MLSNIHPNEWVQYISQPQSIVQSHEDQNRTRTFVNPNQSLKISSPELVTN